MGVVLICGSRKWSDATRIAEIVATLPADTIVIHGAAQGADRLAHIAAVDRGLTVRPYPADWDHHGRAAGPRRNQRMLTEGQPERVIAFRSQGDSRGTDDMVNRAKRAGVPVRIYAHDYTITDVPPTPGAREGRA